MKKYFLVITDLGSLNLNADAIPDEYSRQVHCMTQRPQRGTEGVSLFCLRRPDVFSGECVFSENLKFKFAARSQIRYNQKIFSLLTTLKIWYILWKVCAHQLKHQANPADENGMSGIQKKLP